MRKRILIIIVAVSVALTAMATEPYIIFPVPHEQYVNELIVSFSASVNLVVENGIDEATINRAVQILTEHGLTVKHSNALVKGETNVVLGIFGGHNKNSLGLRPDLEFFTNKLSNKYDRHILSLGSGDGVAQVTIVGEHTDAVFCGLASLEQMLDQGTTNLPCVTICDYADVKSRGIIEGYYGVPYSAEVTKDLFRFMARYKMNTYMYGAKSDPYHSRYWGEPYPTTITPEQQRTGYLTQDMMSDITRVAHETKVNFIWAIHPGKAFANAEDPQVLDKIWRSLRVCIS